MELSYLAIALAVVAQFGAGFLWYGPLFGGLWGRIHGFDKLSRETQQKMMKEMGPYYATQFLVTIILTVILAIFITNLRGWNPYAMAGFFWFGFIFPTQVSAVIFSNTPKEWIPKKIAVQAGGALVCIEIAAIILNLF